MRTASLVLALVSLLVAGAAPASAQLSLLFNADFNADTVGEDSNLDPPGGLGGRDLFLLRVCRAERPSLEFEWS